MASRKILDRGLPLTPEQVEDEKLNLGALVKAAEKAAAEVHAFAAGAEQSDDITLLSLIYCGPEDNTN